jgi:RNA polymerase sigma-70 factor (TIGR02960 family)
VSLEAARRGDELAFGELVAPYRRELHAHCYRMLGSNHDAEDALQNTLLGAWQGIAGFEGRSSLRSWLYRIATNACLRLIERTPKRVLAADFGPARTSTTDLGDPITERLFVEPYPAGPEDTYELRESVELAYVAALQLLPATQRAVLILREVLAFSAAEVAEHLDTSVASVNSALQRARKTLEDHRGPESQQQVLRTLGEARQQELVTTFIEAWERSDVDALIELLVEDARFTMPPLPAWYDGITDIRRFMTDRIIETRWRALPITASGQLAIAFYRERPDGFGLVSVTLLTVRGDRIAEMNAFLDPDTHVHFGLPEKFPA